MAAVAKGILRCMSHSWRGILKKAEAVKRSSYSGMATSSGCTSTCSTGAVLCRSLIGVVATTAPVKGVVGVAMVVDAIHDACHRRRPQVLVLLLSPFIVPRRDWSTLRVEERLFALDCFRLLPERHFDDAHASRPHVSLHVWPSLAHEVGRRDGIVRRRCHRRPELFVGKVWQPKRYGRAQPPARGRQKQPAGTERSEPRGPRK